MVAVRSSLAASHPKITLPEAAITELGSREGGLWLRECLKSVISTSPRGEIPVVGRGWQKGIPPTVGMTIAHLYPFEHSLIS